MNEKIEKMVMSDKIRNNNNETGTNVTSDGERLFKLKNQGLFVIVYEFDAVQLQGLHENVMITILNPSDLQ